MADRDEEQPARSFKVADRRRFVDDAATDEREADREREAERDRAPSPDQSGAPSHDFTTFEAGADAGHGEPPAEMTFSTFVIGLTTQALMHLGEITDPTQQGVGRDLPAAKQMIDLLGILHEKTKGNLDQAEAQLLDSMLYDLRMRFVEVSRGR